MPFHGKARRRTRVWTALLYTALGLAAAALAVAGEPAGAEAAAQPACHAGKGWDAACLRALYGGPSSAWPIPAT